MRKIEDKTCDFYLPEGSGFDTLIWFHGGGLEGGTRRDMSFAEQVADAGLAVCSPDYRMYPNAKFPDYIVDGANAVAYAVNRANELGGSGRVYVSGQSAGAYITLMLALDGKYLDEAKADRNMILGYISDSAQTTVHYNVLRERGLDTRIERIDEAAPLYFVSEKTELPALLLIYYQNDIPCRMTQNILLYDSLNRIRPGIFTEKLLLPGGHVHGSTVKNPDGSFDFVNAVKDFINKRNL